MQLAIGFVLSALIGVSLGLIGGGGSIITVPVLVYVFGVPPHRAVAMSLAVVGSTALASVVLHHRMRSVAWRTGIVFAAGGILSAYGASRLTRFVAPSVLMLIFAALMLVVAGTMLARRAPEPDAAHVPNVWRELLAGLGVGALTGFLGVGGGFLIVPALVVFGGLGMRAAIGTSLFVIAVNCAAGLLGHLSEAGFDVRLTLVIAALAVGGAVVGTRLSHRVHHASLRRVFAWFVVAVALYLVARNYNAIF